jgi:hypothetical protein
MRTKKPPLALVPNLTRAEAMEVERLAELAAIEELKKVRAKRAKAQSRAAHNPKRKWHPTDRQRHQIKLASAAGFGPTAIANIIGVNLSMLERECARELANGADEANAKVAAKLFQKCMRGDTIAMIYWTKTRLGWREVHRTEHTGADGGPIKHQTIAAEAEAFRGKIAQLAERHKIVAAAANDRVPEAAEPEGKETCSPSS